MKIIQELDFNEVSNVKIGIVLQNINWGKVTSAKLRQGITDSL